MRSIVVDIYIPADEYLRIYQGTARVVHARSRDGLRIQFPANILHKFLTHEGVRGSFEILFDDSRKFAGIRQLS